MTAFRPVILKGYIPTEIYNIHHSLNQAHLTWKLNVSLRAGSSKICVEHDLEKVIRHTS